ncbi:MAG: T9SS type A sorting domain-containing protein [Rhodothermaceae bacterium]|nr:T9SS type A sorting domain-containing protein [Rhodothermaceae bacterium]
MRSLLCLLAVLILSPSARVQTFTDASSMLSAFGGSSVGVGVMDVNGDFLTDLVGQDVVYLQRDSGFEPVGLSEDFTLGVIFGDYDRDGRLEAVRLDAFQPEVLRFDPAGQQFLPVPDVVLVPPKNLLIQGSSWLDYDQDGWLDLLLGIDPGIDQLYRNNGDGTLTDVSTTAIPALERGTYGMEAVDYDRDGDTDIYIGLCIPIGEESQNLLYRNNGDGTFTEVGAAAGLDDIRSTWGVAWFDYDNDGWLDVYTANMPIDGAPSGFNGLYRNQGDGTFEDVAVAAGVAGLSEDDSWNVVAADFDNDGWTDLFVANRPDASRLFRNNGDGTFADVTTTANVPTLQSFNAGAGDVNDDGWQDLFILPVFGDDLLLLNDGGSNGWLSIRLRGVASEADGIDARVEVAAGGLSLVREVRGGNGMMGHSHALRAHVGLGTATTADVTVRWPSGQVDVLTGVAANQEITIVEGIGLNSPPSDVALGAPADGAEAGPGSLLTWEPAVDADGDALMYRVFLSGPDGASSFETTETAFTLPADIMTGGAYRWTVASADPYTARTSTERRTFVGGVVAAEPGVPDLHDMTVGPNPVGAVATLRFALATPQAVTVEVFDVLGRRVLQEVLGRRAAGAHRVPLSFEALGPGVYVLRLSGSGNTATTQRITRVQ